MDKRPKDVKMLCLRFNQDGNSFICGTEDGMRLYIPSILVHDYKVGSVKICGMLNGTNVLYFVSGDKNQLFPDNQVQFFDVAEQTFFAKLECPTTITAVCTKPDKIAVSTKKSLSIYSYPKLERLIEMEAAHNPKGLLQMAPLISGTFPHEIVVYPGRSRGSMEILDITNIKPDERLSPATLQCHYSGLVCIALNPEGTLAATASFQDKYIRLWDTVAKTMLSELKLGYTMHCDAAICSLTFDETSNYVCCTNDRKIGYVFEVGSREMCTLLGQQTSYFEPLSHLEAETICRNVCAFAGSDTVNVVSFDGFLETFIYDMNHKSPNVCNVTRRIDIWDIQVQLKTMRCDDAQDY